MLDVDRTTGPVTRAIAAMGCDPEPPRRAWLKAAGVATALIMTVGRGAHAGSVDTDHPDAALLALGARLDAAWVVERNLGADCRADDTPEKDAAFEKTFDACSSVVEQIEDLTATTLAGVIVKARACWWCHDGEPFEDNSLNRQATTDVRLAAGILRDLLAMGGKA